MAAGFSGLWSEMMDHRHVQQQKFAERSEVHDAGEVIEMICSENADSERDAGHEDGAHVRRSIARMELDIGSRAYHALPRGRCTRTHRG